MIRSTDEVRKWNEKYGHLVLDDMVPVPIQRLSALAAVAEASLHYVEWSQGAGEKHRGAAYYECLVSALARLRETERLA